MSLYDERDVRPSPETLAFWGLTREGPTPDPAPCYEVHPDGDGLWVLYAAGGDGLELVAWFPDKGDAEFAAAAFRARGKQ